VDEPITSPTFTIVCEYEGRLPLYHVDVYRLGERAADEPLGLEEYLEGDGVTAVEWAEWLEPLLPEERLVVRIETLGDETNGPDTSGLRRILHFEARGARPAALLEEVVRRWSN
jgi:tRNA threonylcarbamoyladenosine biosynthesis protein TsaE